MRTLSLCVAGLICARLLHAQLPQITPAMHLQAYIDAPSLIGELLEQQLIPVPVSEVKTLVIHDLTSDGFGEGDVLELLPQGEVHVLTGLSVSLRQRMREWTFAANREVRAPVNVTQEELRQANQPVASLLADLLAASHNNLGAGPFELALDRNQEELVLRIWDYSSDSLYSRGNLATEAGFDRRVMDVVQIVRQDTTYIVDQTLHDLLILESTVVDTVYLGGKAGEHEARP